jgi:hypothetical protein
MSSLYRYLSERHLENFLQSGEMLFRSLSYYRDYEEDNGVRSDELEGTRVHLPKEGLKLNLVETGQEVLLPNHRFESTANENDIFVFCLGTVFSESIAERFKAKYCVEICEPSRFICTLRGALARRPSIKDKLLVFDSLKYYEPWHPPIIDWALPEKIAFSKPQSFSWQHEYRIAFSKNNAFGVENVRVNLAPLENRARFKSSEHPKLKLKAGKISGFCKVHSF